MSQDLVRTSMMIYNDIQKYNFAKNWYLVQPLCEISNIAVQNGWWMIINYYAFNTISVDNISVPTSFSSLQNKFLLSVHSLCGLNKLFRASMTLSLMLKFIWNQKWKRLFQLKVLFFLCVPQWCCDLTPSLQRAHLNYLTVGSF